VTAFDSGIELIPAAHAHHHWLLSGTMVVPIHHRGQTKAACVHARSTGSRLVGVPAICTDIWRLSNVHRPNVAQLQHFHELSPNALSDVVCLSQQQQQH